MDVITDQKNVKQAEFMNLTVGKRTLNYSGEDIFFKLAKNEIRPVAIESAPVYFVGADGKTYDLNRYKVGIRNNQIAGIMSKKYTFISNEKAYELISDTGFKPSKVEFAHEGNAMFVEVFSDDAGTGTHTWSNDPEGGDKMEVGVMMRNSIDGTMAFGGDIFTYRSRCSNGAIIGKKDLGSFSVKHVGDYHRLIATVRAHITRAFRLSEKVREYYIKSAEVKMNDEMAKALVATQLPKKFLPDFVNLIKVKNAPTQIVLEDKNRTVWDAFNGITERAWHENGLSIVTKRQYTERANAWLLNTVEPLLVA